MRKISAPLILSIILNSIFQKYIKQTYNKIALIEYTVCMRNLILTGGGTAGHCIPALSILPYVEKQFDNVYYIGSENGIERDIVQKHNVKYYSVTTVKLRRNISLSNFSIPFKLLKGVSEAKKLLKSLNATTVFSKGGFVALPVCIASGQLKIPLIIHESDLTMGLTNKISVRYARELLTSFQITAENHPKGIWTGAPISPLLFGASKAQGRLHYGINNNNPVLLVIGGSSGSTAINSEIRAILPKLTSKYNVLHLVGKGNVSSEHKGILGYYQVEFEPEMKYAYASADFAVSRAGSNCLFELIAMKIPALLIPLPKGASRGDQIDNAKYFKQKGMFDVLLQENLTPERLLSGIESTYKNRLNYILAQQKHANCANEAIAKRIIRASLSK